MVELIHADAHLRELGAVVDFSLYDACAALSSTGTQSDWMLEMPAEVYAADPIARGDYIYIPGTEFGGRCERVRRSTSDGSVRLYGALWRGMLARRIITPPPGKTHFELSGLSGAQALEQLLGSWNQGLMAVSQAGGDLTVSARIRYRTLSEAAEEALASAGGRLELCFDNGVLTLAAGRIRDLSGDIELSDEYTCSLISDSRSAVYNHIIALGRGEMLERQVVELWLLPDGTVTDESAASDGESSTLLYDYTFAESLTELTDAARRKLAECAAGSLMEFEFADNAVQLDLCDRVCVRDTVVGTSAVMSVAKKLITISENGVCTRHVLA